MKPKAIVAGIAFFILSVLGKDIASTGIQLWYRLNKEAIAQEHCVNKDKPEMKCDGKCYLAKQLAKVENIPATGEKAPKSEVKAKPLYWISEKSDVSAPVIILSEKTASGIVSVSRYSFDHTKETFHPPCVRS